MRRIIRMVAVLAVLAAFLSGCGGSGEEGKIGATAEQQAATQDAPVKVTQKTEYYEITGDTEAELRYEMNQKGISWNDGRTYDALTTWKINWTYNFDCRNASCAIGSFNSEVEIIFRYPKWNQPPDAAPALIQKWNTYIANLTNHENGHRDLAIAAAADLTRSVYSMPPAPETGELERALQALADVRMAQLNTDEISYDTTTYHGAVQGAVFP